MSKILNKALAIRAAKKLGINSDDLVHVGNGLWSTTITITPELAKEWLKRNNHNRKKKNRAIKNFVDDIKNGKFKFSHEGIAFGFDANLKDGQNTLESISLAETPIERLVFIGVSDEVRGVINQGTSRTAMDAAFFDGVATSSLGVSASKFCENGLIGGRTVFSNSKTLDIVAKHRDAYHFVAQNLGCKRDKYNAGLLTAPIMGAIMRAYYANKDNVRSLARLKKFCSILKDGQYNGVMTDYSAAKLRDMAMSKNWSGSKYSNQLYRLTQNAIVNFLNKKEIERLRTPVKEQFPFEVLTVEAGE